MGKKTKILAKMRVLLCLASAAFSQRAQYPIIGDNSIMDPKEHGTCMAKPTENLRWGCNEQLADYITCFNRIYPEDRGYFQQTGFPAYAKTEEHGWPSFRDSEVVWENVRCLKTGETV